MSVYIVSKKTTQTSSKLLFLGFLLEMSCSSLKIFSSELLRDFLGDSSKLLKTSSSKPLPWNVSWSSGFLIRTGIAWWTATMTFRTQRLKSPNSVERSASSSLKSHSIEVFESMCSKCVRIDQRAFGESAWFSRSEDNEASLLNGLGVNN